MKITLAILLYICTLLPGFSQIIKIEDAETGKPIPLVSVFLTKKHSYFAANSHGEIDISILKDLSEIEFRALGYVTTKISYSELLENKLVLKLKATNFQLDEVVISGNRQVEKNTEIPSKISSISPKKLFLQNPQTTADLLGISGKVFIQKSQQGGGSPMIRGFATNRLLYSVDGVRMNTAIFRGGNIQNVISLDPFAIERTEILFGAGSVMYGSDAIGGVMSFTSITPEFSLTKKPAVFGKAVSKYSSANTEKTAHADFGIGFKKLAFVTSFSTFNYGHLTMGTHGSDTYLRPFYVERINNTDSIIQSKNPLVQNPTGYSQINVMQKVRYAPANTFEINYGFHYSETSNYSRYDRHIYLRNGKPRYGRWDYGPQIWQMHNLSVSDSKSNSMYDLLTIRFAFQQFEESRISRNFKSEIETTNTENVNAYSTNADFLKNLSANATFFYGLEWVSNHVKSAGIEKNLATNTEKESASRYPRADWNSYAIYLTYKHKFTDTFLINTGLRYNFFNINALFDTRFFPFPFTTANLNNSAVTGSLGYVWRINKNWITTGNFATAFRAPNIDDMGKVFDSEPGSVVVPNPNLDAEYAYNLDFGIAGTISELLKIDFSIFNTWLINALVRRDFELNGNEQIMYLGELSKVQAIQNAAVANVYGIQAGLELKLPAGFGLSSDINYTKGVEETDDGTLSPSRHAAPLFGVSKISYKHKKLDLLLLVNYSGAKLFNEMPQEELSKPYLYVQDANGNSYSPAWYAINFNAVYNIVSGLSLSGGIENITNRRYRPYSSGLVAPGRNFIISAKFVF